MQFTTVYESVSNLPPAHNVYIFSRRIMESVHPTLAANISYNFLIYGSPLQICTVRNDSF